MPALWFLAGMLFLWVYSPSDAAIARHAMTYCGPDHPEDSRPSYCPKSCP